jgi:hypothetical protein
MLVHMILRQEVMHISNFSFLYPEKKMEPNAVKTITCQQYNQN